MRGLREALRLSWGAGRALLLAFVCVSCLGGFLPLATALLMKTLIDEIVQGGSRPAVLSLGALTAAAGLAVGVLPHILQYVQAELERRVRVLAQRSLFEAVGRFVGLGRFEDPQFADRLRLAHQNGGATPALIVGSGLLIARSTVTGLGFLGTLTLLAPWLPIAVLVSAAPSLLGEIRHARRRSEAILRLGPAERREIFYRELLTDPQAAKEVRLFGIGKYLQDRMLRELTRINDTHGRLGRREAVMQSLVATVTAVVAGVVLMWATLAASAGRITVGEVSLVVAALAAVQAAAVALVREVGRCHGQLLLFGHYLYVRQADPDLRVPDAPRRVPALREGIEFRDVWFRYSPDHPWILRGVHLKIPHGRSLGLAGRNGAGKTTLIKLLLRLYDPQRGSILWDGIDIREFDPVELRRHISAVFQDFMHYDLTVAENIGLGDLARDRDAVRLAAEAAGAGRFVEQLPKGYDTLLSRIFFHDDELAEGVGVNLSGGQWQRIAVARAQLRADRDLLILDEPSSGLDAEAESEIHQKLSESRAGRTSLLITHRLGAIREADFIVMLDEGVVAEVGTHRQLMAAEGIYAHLFVIQAQGYTSMEGAAT